MAFHFSRFVKKWVGDYNKPHTFNFGTFMLQMGLIHRSPVLVKNFC